MDTFFSVIGALFVFGVVPAVVIAFIAYILNSRRGGS